MNGWWVVTFFPVMPQRSETRGIAGGTFALEIAVAALVAAIATHTVGDRPDRYEPRVKKRRAKEYDLMNTPRAEYKRQMAK